MEQKGHEMVERDGRTSYRRPAWRVAAVAGAVLSGLSATVVAVSAEEQADVDTFVIVGTAVISTQVPLVGGVGNFSFGSSACAFASESGPGGEAGEPLLDAEAGAGMSGSCSATANGSYVNAVCGTGIVYGSGSLVEGSSSDSYTVPEFQIVFVAGVGYLTGLAYESDPDGGGPTETQPLYGVVTASPVPDISDLGQVPPPCARTFVVTVTVVTTA